MKLGVMNPALYSMSIEEAFKYLNSLGVQAVELGVGGYPGNTHTEAFLSGERSVDELKELLKKYELTVSAVSCHGNPVHPQKDIADKFHKEFEAGVLFAEKLGVNTINGFSGCPGDSAGSKWPNWVTCAWPDDFGEVVKYQWDEVIIPYWTKMGKFMNDHGVRVAFEMHPGFCVYNPYTLLRLRKAVGDVIGANFDPSHLIWQGMDPVAAIRELEGAIYHFHAKDTRIDKYNTAKNGVLDYRHFSNNAERSWNFRTVGYGMGDQMWKEIVIALRTIGYDGALSIEHEDNMMSVKEGLEKAIAVLKNALVFEESDGMWWA
ncbi:sugar phosphate isomerase/epimerase [Oscillospiraceae bacterium OttesenSCG-928-F05]|nr:sugar phosphate isomerase/epimerase [Oscillospiraceae bacterium OttesenSCG-928-F05]